MASNNEKQNQTIAQALATPVEKDQPRQQPPLYSPVRETKPDPKIIDLLSPLKTEGLGGSASSSSTAVSQGQGQNSTAPITAQPLAKATPTSTSSRSTYDSWNPADASNKDGRPPWWNRWFCCGYGVGCVLCLCGSPTCWQERQKQVVDGGAGGQEAEKRV